MAWRSATLRRVRVIYVVRNGGRSWWAKLVARRTSPFSPRHFSPGGGIEGGQVRDGQRPRAASLGGFPRRGRGRGGRYRRRHRTAPGGRKRSLGLGRGGSWAGEGEGVIKLYIWGFVRLGAQCTTAFACVAGDKGEDGENYPRLEGL